MMQVDDKLILISLLVELGDFLNRVGNISTRHCLPFIASASVAGL